MEISVKVKLRSKQSKLEKVEDLLGVDNGYLAYIMSPPIDGKANDELIKLVSDYFHIRKKQVTIVSGQTNTIKKLRIQI